jgi:hypothetical protein
VKLITYLLAACAVLWGGALAGGAARAGKGRTPRATDDLAYQRSEINEIPVGDSLEVNGQPMQLSIFYTSDAPPRVVEFYAQAFEARGVLPIISADPHLASVAGFDTKDGLQRFISALPQPDGQTLVLVGVTNPRRPPRFTKGADESGIPLPAENRAYLGYKSSDEGAQAETGQFVSPLSPAAVLAWYRRELPARGWAERAADGSPSLGVFAKQGAVLSVAVQALSDQAGSAVFVNQTSGGGQ